MAFVLETERAPRGALLIGQGASYVRMLAGVFGRAGFGCDVLTTDRRVKRSAPVRDLTRVANEAALIEVLAGLDVGAYAVVVIGDDHLLALIRDADLDGAQKLRLLPVTGPEHFGHLGSKVGLDAALKGSPVRTPRSEIVGDEGDLAEVCGAVGYPVMVKVDSSAGGIGIFECASPEDVEGLEAGGMPRPLLVQEKIDGELMDFSGFFQDGKLVHFGASRIDAFVAGGFSPSSVRTYFQLSEVGEDVFDELAELGRTLGLDGFANISCLESARDGERYYIEADVRPNLWADHPRYLGDDPAVAIREYFEQGTVMRFPRPRVPSRPAEVVMALLFRLRAKDVLRNRYGVWRFVGSYGIVAVARHVLPSWGRVLEMVRGLFAR